MTASFLAICAAYAVGGLAVLCVVVACFWEDWTR